MSKKLLTSLLEGLRLQLEIGTVSDVQEAVAFAQKAFAKK